MADDRNKGEGSIRDGIKFLICLTRRQMTDITRMVLLLLFDCLCFLENRRGGTRDDFDTSKQGWTMYQLALKLRRSGSKRKQSKSSAQRLFLPIPKLSLTVKLEPRHSGTHYLSVHPPNENVSCQGGDDHS